MQRSESTAPTVSWSAAAQAGLIGGTAYLVLELMLVPLFVGGTSSNAGKSWMATAICAHLRRQGVAVAPFKAQNMSNHSYPCRAGGEIGRAQVAQAEACGLEPEPAMNPILLKPTGDGSSQVVLNGRVWKTMSAREYYEHAASLRSAVLDAYDRLARRHDVIVIEGAQEHEAAPDERAARRTYELLASELEPAVALRLTSAITGVSRNDLYRLVRTPAGGAT